MSLYKWKQAVDYQIEVILEEDTTQDNAILLASLMYLQDKWKAPTSEAFPGTTVPLVGITDKKASNYFMLIEHELDDADEYFSKGSKIIARNEMSHAMQFLEQARQYAYLKEEQEKVKAFQVRRDIMAQKIK